MSIGGGGGDRTPEPTEQEKALAETAKAQFDFQQEHFRPLENELLARTAATPERLAEAKGSSNADVAQAFSAAPTNRNSIKKAGLASAEAGGAAKGATGTAVQFRGLQGKLAFSALGHGVASTANLGLMSATNRATSSAILDARIKLQDDQSLASGLAAGVGAYSQASGLLNRPDTKPKKKMNYGPR